MHAFANESESLRLGLSVSKKVGNAVVRNTLRRRLREIFADAAPSPGTGMDLVVSARPAARDASFADLQEEFSKALVRLRVRDERDRD